MKFHQREKNINIKGGGCVQLNPVTQMNGFWVVLQCKMATLVNNVDCACESLIKVVSYCRYVNLYRRIEILGS